MRKPIRMISAREIRENYSMKQAINAMEGAFASLSSGDSFVPQRFITKLPSGDLVMLFKPAYVEQEKRISVKFLTQREGIARTDIPTIQGIVLVIDAVTGEVLAIMDGEYLTALRTGAASGLATRYFARKDARTMALFGCGAQGRTQLEAVLCERGIKKVLVFDKNREAADLFVQEMQEKFQTEMRYSTETAVLKDADIICTATNSSTPLFMKDEIKSGVHINAIGSFQPHMQELDPDLIRDAKVYVDQVEICLKESGDLIKPIADKIIDQDHLVGEIGEFCLGNIEGRESKDEITIFKSVGVAIQDFAVAIDICSSSVKKDFGNEIRLFE